MSKRNDTLERANLDTYFRTREVPQPMRLEEGARVAYTRYFLKCTGEPATGARWQARGTVTEGGCRFAKVLWDGESEAKLVNTGNLAPVGANRRFCE